MAVLSGSVISRKKWNECLEKSGMGDYTVVCCTYLKIRVKYLVRRRGYNHICFIKRLLSTVTQQLLDFYRIFFYDNLIPIRNYIGISVLSSISIT